MRRLTHVLGAANYGGVETMALRLLRYLPPTFEHELVFLQDQPGARFDEFRALARVPVSTCAYVPGERRDFLRRLRAHLAARRPDVVLSYTFGNHAMVTYAAKKAGAARAFVRVAGSPLRTRATRLKSTLLAHAARPFCDGEIAVSAEVARELVSGLGLPGRRVTVIPNGCEPLALAERAEAGRKAREDEGVRIVMVSRMDDAKDHATLLAAFAEAGDALGPASLDLVGEGPLRPVLEAQARALGLAERVRFLGDRADAVERMGGADLVVHATRSEGFPNVLLEAMASGVPVVASALPVCREILADGACGRLVPVGDAPALAAALRELAADAGERERLARAARSRVAAEYDIRRTAARYAAVLAGGTP